MDKTLFEHYPLSQIQNIVWNDMDAFQHINNTVYFRYFEDIRVVMLEALGVFNEVKTTQIGPVVASTKCDYRSPLVYPDTITTVAWVEDIREKKYTMKYQIFSHQQARCVAEGEALIVYCDFKAGKSALIPAHTLEGLKSYEKNHG